ncbi:MAG TPA: ABC transporter substrate-binding protein [Methylomirabilota bacterium]|nr:ABC transporter substrate-binding protein [Methylomirabilota bacterium]
MAIWVSAFIVAVWVLCGVPGAAQELPKVPVQIPAITPAATAFVVARDRGYYRQEGLDVQLIVMPSAIGTQALIGGNVKFSTAGGAGLLPILRGAPMRFLFTTFNRPMFWLYAKSDIPSVEALKGKKVGVSSLGSGPDSLLRDLLKKHRLEGGREVIILPMGAGTARFYALQAGSIDAAMLSIPGNFMAQEAGFRELVSFIKQEWVELQGTINVTDQLLASDPVLVEKFVRGTLKGFIHFRDLRSDTAAVLAQFLRTREDTAAKIYDVIRPGMTQDGAVSEQIQRKSLEHVVERAGVKEAPRLDKIFDYSLLAKIRQELRTKGWKPEPEARR